MELFEKINALDKKARSALGSPALALAAPGAKAAIVELVDVIRELALAVESTRGRLAVFEKMKRGNDGKN